MTCVGDLPEHGNHVTPALYHCFTISLMILCRENCMNNTVNARAYENYDLDRFLPYYCKADRDSILCAVIVPAHDAELRLQTIHP